MASPKEEVTKPLKTVVNSVRYGKDLKALENFAGEEQGKILVADDWLKGTDAQRKEFIELFKTLFGKIAFPKIRKNFENLDTILYDDPVINGDAADVASTILINHPMKKQELKVKYHLVKTKAGWQVVDVAVLGDSMLKGIRDDQVQPLLKEGGWDNLLKAMRDKVAELKDVPLK
jgi:phospholipid transport system substrate-binding protein